MPREIGTEIAAAIPILRNAHGLPEFTTWEENDIAGRFLVSPILENIHKSECVVADITKLNFNVAFEIGYAIGAKRRIMLVRNSSLEGDQALFPQLGIFDTLGHEAYSSGEQLASKIAAMSDRTPLPLVRRHSGGRPRLFLLEPSSKTTYDISLASSIKKAQIGFERYDPAEKGRLSAAYAIESVAKEDALVAVLLPRSRTDWLIHNIRVAFCAGIAHALGRDFLLLQESEDPVPLDYRELVRWISSPDEISRAIGDLVLRLYATLHAEEALPPSSPTSLLERLNLGSSIAENESQALGNYYLETEQFKQAVRGEVQAVTGRKGSGKTAFFLELRNSLRRNPQNIVLDLQPEGFQILKFKDRCLGLLAGGSKEHLLTALWEYVLLLEIAVRILRDDRGRHVTNHNLNKPYQDLSRLVLKYRESGSYMEEGDFAERLDRVLADVEKGLLKMIDSKRTDNTLSNPMVTELLYQFDLKTLRELIESYAQFKAGVWILVDNLDKGWPATGLTEDDTRIIRCLQSALKKIERPLQRQEIQCRGIVFLRSDIYRLIVDATPDKGKTQAANVDLTNRDILREILRLRIAFSLGDDTITLEGIWPSLFVTHIGSTAEETCTFLIDRSMMRPRCFIDLVKACRSNAVTLQRTKVQEPDLQEGLSQYSVELASNIGFEIRDVYPNAPDILFEFIGCGRRLLRSNLDALLLKNGIPAEECEKFIDLLLWYGVLGPIGIDDVAHYVFDQRYELRKLKAVHAHLQEGADPSYEINPAFWAALEIDTI
jgi:hypothetical protein